MRRAAVAAALALALAGCSGSGTDGGMTIGEDLVTEWTAGEGPGLPAISGTTIEEEAYALPTGKPMVVNLWAVWCGPCKAEAPALSKLSKEFGDEVEFVGVNVRDQGDLKAAVGFHEKYDLDFPSLDDRDGDISLALRDIVGAGFPPQTLVVGADGKVVGKFGGRADESVLRTLLEDVTSATEGGSATS